MDDGMGGDKIPLARSFANMNTYGYNMDLGYVLAFFGGLGREF